MSDVEIVQPIDPDDNAKIVFYKSFKPKSTDLTSESNEIENESTTGSKKSDSNLKLKRLKKHKLKKLNETLSENQKTKQKNKERKNRKKNKLANGTNSTLSKKNRKIRLNHKHEKKVELNDEHFF